MGEKMPKSGKAIEARIVHKLDIRNSTQPQGIVLRLVSGQSDFHFLLTEDAAKNLAAGLDKALVLLQESGSHATH